MPVSDIHSVHCPECGHVIDLDDASYARLLQEVRDEAFRRELDEREAASVRLAVSDAERRHTTEIADLRAEMSAMKSQHDAELRGKDAEIEFYRDFKARQSTKMIGESLERYCEDAFNKIRAVAFPDAYFEKDNEVSRSTGSKGDFIFRDFAPDGSETVSIMFEMKNEADTTDMKSRHKNSDFFKELDKDRAEKHCEYAILVSMLEADSELYNQGIVDVSHRYPKMYVIRPQFFIPVIGFLRNAALQRLDLQAELAEVRSQNADMLRFESVLDDFKIKFGKNVGLAQGKFESCVAEIDKAIAALEKAKAALAGADKNLKYADDKLDALSIIKLIKGNPTMQALYSAQHGGT